MLEKFTVFANVNRHIARQGYEFSAILQSFWYSNVINCLKNSVYIAKYGLFWNSDRDYIILYDEMNNNEQQKNNK